MRLLTWYVGEAVKRDDRYLLSKMSADLALYACRVVLAYSRILYPYHKWLMQRVQTAPERPAGFLEAVDALLAAPGVETARALCGCVDTWQDWGVSLDEAVVGFMEESEWNWRNGPAPLADR